MRYIKLTQGQRAIVDDDMYEYLNQWKWHAMKHGVTYYAARKDNDSGKNGQSRSAILMHRVILAVPDDKGTDHINHDGLDNRILNLRICSASENQGNRLPSKNCTSKYKGVSRDGKKWRAKIQHRKVSYSLGVFCDEISAAQIYDVKAKELFGEYARLNF